MVFEFAIPVRFADVDAAGIVYYPKYFDYCHVAFEELFGALHGTPYPQWIQEHRVGFPTVHVEADFASPLRFGDTARIRVTVPRRGQTSLDFSFELRREADGETVARAVVTKVCVDMDTLRPTAIPDDLIGCLVALEEEE